MRAIGENYLRGGLGILHPPVSWSRLALWLGVGEVAQRKWMARLPAVITASFILLTFMWAADFHHVEYSLVMALGLLAIAISLQQAE
jgi:hypothetical protein